MEIRFFHNKKLKRNLLDYGIEIPLGYNSILQTLEELNSPKYQEAFKQRLIQQDFVNINYHDLKIVHDEDFIDSVFSDQPEKTLLEAYELVNRDGSYKRYNPQKATKPLRELINLHLGHVEGALTSSLWALKHKEITYFLGGGMHHAMKDRGRGFCLFNDISFVLKKLKNEGLINSAWVIDVDVHKGDGTANLLKNEKELKTLSIHMKDGWPLNKEMYADTLGKTPSDIDIEIGINEEDFYLEKLKTGIQSLEQSGKPDFVIIVGGVDPYEKDELDSSRKIKLTLDQMLERDMFLFNYVQQKNIPTTFLAAGGYGKYSYECYSQFFKKMIDWVHEHN